VQNVLWVVVEKRLSGRVLFQGLLFVAYKRALSGVFFGDSSVDLVDIVKLTDTFAYKLFAFCYFFSGKREISLWIHL